MFQTPLSSGLVPTTNTNNITHVVNRPLNSVVTNVTTTGTSAINLSSTPLNTQNVSNPTKEVVPVVVPSQDSFQVRKGDPRDKGFIWNEIKKKKKF